MAHVAIAGAFQQLLEGVGREFVRVFRVDALAGLKGAFAARPAQAQGAARLQVHFDARALGVVQGDMAPVPDLEIAGQQRVHVPQQVQVEGRRQLQRIVVGGLEHLARLDAVHPDQQAAVRTEPAHMPQHGQRVIGIEVADAGAGIEEQAPCGRNVGGQGQALREILSQRRHPQLGIGRAQAARGGFQVVRGNVDGHVAARPAGRGTGARPWRSRPRPGPAACPRRRRGARWRRRARHGFRPRSASGSTRAVA